MTRGLVALRAGRLVDGPSDEVNAHTLFTSPLQLAQIIHVILIKNYSRVHIAFSKVTVFPYRSLFLIAFSINQ
jgi:hypothetical protein